MNGWSHTVWMDVWSGLWTNVCRTKKFISTGLPFAGERERDCIEQGPRQKLFFPGLDLSRPWDSSPGTLFYGAGTIDQYEW